MKSNLSQILKNSKKSKNDNFYTQLCVVEDELKNYQNYFENKIVFCNCNDDENSAFWNYFCLNFDHLKLKKLIGTHFTKKNSSYKLELTANIHEVDNNKKNTVLKTKLQGNGDFRSKECIDLLKECDVVVTNPPFSLFREFVGLLMKHNKKFLIIGNQNAITYKEIFPLIKENKLWWGITMNNKNIEFIIPNVYAKYLKNSWFNPKVNKRVTSLGNVCWYTNFRHKQKNEEIILFKKYKPEEYAKYDNYDAINIDKICDIPEDYFEEMGVPITFLNKYNPEQFVIIGMGTSRKHFCPIKEYKNVTRHKASGNITKSLSIKDCLMLSTKIKPKNKEYYTVENCTNHFLIKPYARIIIKRINK